MNDGPDQTSAPAEVWGVVANAADLAAAIESILPDTAYLAPGDSITITENGA